MKPQTIADARTAQLLLNPDFMGCLDCLFTDQWSIAALAKKLGLTIGVTHYRVLQLLEQKLVVISQEKQRAGRSIKYYTASAKAFFVPFALTSAETLLTFWLGILEPKHQTFVKHLVRNAEVHEAATWGVIIQYTPESGLQIINAGKQQNSQTPVAWLNEEDLYLSHENARELQLELRNLIAKYKQLSGSEAYIIQNGLVWAKD